MKLLSDAKARVGSIISSLASVLGVGSSSTSVVCQTTCSTSSSVLPFLGLSLAATPFAFIQDYQLYIWWFAFFLFILTLWVSLKRNFRSRLEQGLLLINAGLLVIGLPYLRASQAFILIIILGISLLIVGIYQAITAKKFVIQFTNQYEAK
ncbi:MAG: hypothetical protein M1366_01075 [Patescibacteria group bacterium]|nr:hypothetical protein [Patescibacteria group bacterium]